MPYQAQSNYNQSKSEPHPYIQGDLLGLLDSMRGWLSGNPTAPLYQVANPSAAQDSAEQSAWGWGTTGLNGLDAAFNPAISSLNDTLSGKYLDPKLNTAFQDFLSASFRPQAEQFRDIIAPAIDAKFAGSGRTAGGAHFDTTMRGVQDLQRAQSDAAAKAGLGLYQGERSLMASAAPALSGVLGAKTGIANSWLNVLQGVGNRATANDQARLDATRANFFAQPDFLTGMGQRFLGGFPGGQNISSGTTMAWGDGGGGGGGGASQFIGPAASVAGAAIIAL